MPKSPDLSLEKRLGGARRALVIVNRYHRREQNHQESIAMYRDWLANAGSKDRGQAEHWLAYYEMLDRAQAVAVAFVENEITLLEQQIEEKKHGTISKGTKSTAD